MDEASLDQTTETSISPISRSPARGSSESITKPSGSAPSLVTNPRQALEIAEARRIRTLARVVIALAVSVAGTVLILPANPLAQVIHLAGLVPVLVTCVALSVRLRDIESYRPWMAVLFAGAAGIGVASVFVYWGVFSSGCAIVPIAMYVFSSGQSLRPVYAIMAGAVVPHAVIGVLVTSGVMPDLGIIQPLDLDLLEAVIVLGIAQFLFGIALFLARDHRKATEDAMVQLERAIRSLAQREALLNEAKQELDRALKVGGPGRFTSQVLGSYELGNLLGRGAMGEVYEAHHVETEQPAAVKLLTIAAQRDDHLIARFQRELRIASSLQAKNVVRVLETADPESGGLPYIAMERLQGATLSDILRKRIRFSTNEVLDLVQQLGSGLAAAHEEGIIHRDIKPQNVFRHEEGRQRIWKILDFGISRLAGSETLTQDQLVGTPAYMAPEQAHGETVDHRTDLYSLAVVAYRAFTGRPAFTGKDGVSILYGVANLMPPPPSSLGRGGAIADQIFAIGLAKDPELRFQSAEEMASAFEQLAEGAESLEGPLAKRARAALDAASWPTP